MNIVKLQDIKSTHRNPLHSYIGVETSHRRGPEKRSVIDVVTSIIDGVATGVNFLQLWGEERALD